MTNLQHSDFYKSQLDYLFERVPELRRGLNRNDQTPLEIGGAWGTTELHLQKFVRNYMVALPVNITTKWRRLQDMPSVVTDRLALLMSCSGFNVLWKTHPDKMNKQIDDLCGGLGTDDEEKTLNWRLLDEINDIARNIHDAQYCSVKKTDAQKQMEKHVNNFFAIG